MAAFSQAVAGGLEVAAAALRGDDSSSSSHAEPEQRFAGFGALESVPDLKQGTSAWKRVRTPAQLGGKELRICQTGARLFIELDDEAIPPIAHFMRTKNANQKNAKRGRRVGLFNENGGCILVHNALHVADLASLCALLCQRNAGDGASDKYNTSELKKWVYWASTWLPATHLRVLSSERERVRKRPITQSELEDLAPVPKRATGVNQKVSTEAKDDETEIVRKHFTPSLLASLGPRDCERFLKKAVQLRREGEVRGAKLFAASMEKQIAKNPEVQIAVRHIGGASMNGLERISNACSKEGYARSVRRTLGQRECHKRFKSAGADILAAGEHVWSELRAGTVAARTVEFEAGADDDGHATLASACRAGYPIHRVRGFFAAVDQYLQTHAPETYATFNIKAEKANGIERSHMQTATELAVGGGAQFTRRFKRPLRQPLVCSLHGVNVPFPQLFHKQSVEIRQDEEKRCCHGDGLTLQREHDQVPDRDTTTVVKEKQIKWAGGRNGNFNARRFAEPNQSLPAVESIVNDFLRGDYGALYVGCERAFELGEVDKTGAEIPSWGRVYSVRTWVIEALVKNRAFLKQQSGTMKMTVDASPWVDASPMLDSSLYASSWKLSFDTADFPDLKQHSAEWQSLSRVRLGFLAFARETRRAGNVVARLLGVSLRRAAEMFVVPLPGGLKVEVTVQMGKLKGDYHGLSTLLGVNHNGSASQPMGFAKKKWSDWMGWMEHLEKVGGPMVLEFYLELATQLLKSDLAAREELAFASPADLCCAAPIFAGDGSTPLQDRGMGNVGLILADPEHCLSAVIKNVRFFMFVQSLSW